MAAGVGFRSHKSLLIILLGFLGLFSFTVEADTKKYQFDVSYILYAFTVKTSILNYPFELIFEF